MTIEPYRYKSGAVHGDATQTPGPAPAGKPRRGRAATLKARARRKQADPNWANLSESTKRVLLDLDRAEGHR